MSTSVTPAEARVAVAASRSMSSVERSQCSPKGMQPIPTMHTRSRIPRDPIYASSVWVRRRGGRGVGAGPAGRLPGEETPPGKEGGVAEAVVPGGDLGRHRRAGAPFGQDGRGAEEQHGRAVGEEHEGNDPARLGPVEDV